jgi:hypothetical protein
MIAIRPNGITQDRDGVNWKKDLRLKDVAEACLIDFRRDAVTFHVSVQAAVSLVAEQLPRDFDEARTLMQATCNTFLRSPAGLQVLAQFRNQEVITTDIDDTRPNKVATPRRRDVRDIGKRRKWK